MRVVPVRRNVVSELITFAIVGEMSRLAPKVLRRQGIQTNVRPFDRVAQEGRVAAQRLLRHVGIVKVARLALAFATAGPVLEEGSLGRCTELGI